ncbi:MAG: hypothetical protein DIZ80_05380 [endosymbiont of Galathealinum brachiosum]|uniref:Adenylate cyclase class-I N-terminal domain-containing protein n=1 Tax=endosymbiont of Galathealinum brachiosum TaxID=2200906 RepID=A0A370DIZ5_9GAMM|nr:MAG: hypothetical protein DIZ80_05380 [endosymbiont of Galathealinum brachiosum]
MKIKNTIQVADARQAYLRWNSSRYKQLPEIVGGDIYKYIQLIPLFLQLNNKLLPGYADPDAPAGVFSYKPDKNSIVDAKLLNNKFRYQQEGVINNYAIESVCFHQKLIDKKNSCWIFYRSSLNIKQLTLLKEKINKLSQWFSARGECIDFNCLSVDDFVSNKIENINDENKSLYLDRFYSEMILLAGKYPVWWLVPPEKEKEYTAFVEHIKQARFVDVEEFIDLGGVAELARSDVIKKAIDLVQKIKQSPETCLAELLIIDQKNTSWPVLDGISHRLKYFIYTGKVERNPVDIMAKMMHEAMSHYPETEHILSPVRLFSRLRNMPGQLNHKLVDAFLADDYVYESASTGLENIISYLNFFKAISHEVRQIFSNIVKQYNAENSVSEQDKILASVASNMMAFLSDGDDSVPLYNNKNTTDIILDRIHLKQEITQGSGRWSLVLEVSEGNEKTIGGFNSLLGLLAWCWLNRVVNHSTQVSIESPGQQVKQIEAYYVLEVLIQQLKPDLISNIPAVAFENPVRPLQSLLFVNFMALNKNENIRVTATDDPLSFGNLSENLVTHCEQLIINSWGDVYTKQYSGNTGILNCLCEWTHHAPLDELSKPQKLSVFGHGAGDSTYMAQRVEQVYDEMQSFFYNTRNEMGRFILRMGSEYHVVKVEDSLLKPVRIGKKKALMGYLEAASSSFHDTALERLAYTDYPLREIYQNNKPHVLQVFFQLINRAFYTWVVDENGSLWADVSTIYNRESYITHWLYFFRNISNRLKKINYQERELPGLEINQISINQLGGIEFYAIGADAVSGSKNYIDIQVSINGHVDGDQLSLVCDGRRFTYGDFKQNALIECVQYMSARMTGEGRLPVYVTDIDVPLRIFNVIERDDIQISHILKFKRNFEHKINKLLDS